MSVTLVLALISSFVIWSRRKTPRIALFIPLETSSYPWLQATICSSILLIGAPPGQKASYMTLGETQFPFKQSFTLRLIWPVYCLIKLVSNSLYVGDIIKRYKFQVVALEVNPILRIILLATNILFVSKLINYKRISNTHNHWRYCINNYSMSYAQVIYKALVKKSWI